MVPTHRDNSLVEKQKWFFRQPLSSHYFPQLPSLGISSGGCLKASVFTVQRPASDWREEQVKGKVRQEGERVSNGMAGEGNEGFLSPKLHLVPTTTLHDSP